MKTTFCLQLILGCVVTCVMGFSYTQAQVIQIPQDDTLYCTKTSSICGTAPEKFTLILNFVREMTNAMKTIGTEGDYIGKYINPNRFEGNRFVAPTTNIATATLRNVVQKVEFGLASMLVVLSPVNVGGLKDVVGGVALLLKNKVFLRDNKLVEELESQLSDKKLELGLGGGRFASVNAPNRQLMQTIIKKYIDNGLLVDGTISDGVRYENITSLLTQVVSSAKTVLYLNTVNQFDGFSRGGTNGIAIVFNPGAIQTIQRDYSCARGFVNPCDSSLKAFSGAIHTIVDTANSSASGSNKIIKDALERLGQIFLKTSDQTQEFKDREADLLKSMYGSKKISKGTFADSLKKSWASVKKSGKDALEEVAIVGDKLTEQINGISKFRTFPKNPHDVKDNILATQKDQDIPLGTSDQGKDIFDQYLTSYIQDVFSQQATDSELATLTQVNTITPAFNVLGEQISSIKTIILGGKDQQGSLIKSLGEACQLQCGGGGQCR